MTADLASRLARLEDERDVIATLYRLCEAVDGPSKAAWVESFTEDGIFSWTRSEDGPPLLHVRGHAALGQWFEKHRIKNPDGTQLHLIHLPRAEISAAEARVASHYVTVRKMGGELVTASTGVYRDQLVRGEDGCWRIAEHRAIGTMIRSAEP